MLSLEVVTDRRALHEFVRLPSEIYRGRPGYQPPLFMDRLMMLDPKKSAFWQRSQVQYWLARDGGRPVGRISAQVGAAVPHRVASGTGMFGCLDAIDDLDVIRQLLKVASEWLAARGCTAMMGPLSLDMNEEPGLLVDGSDLEPMTLFPWHPPYLGELLEKAKLAKMHDLHGWSRDLAGFVHKDSLRARKLAERIPNLQIRYPVRRSYARDIQILCDVYNDGWSENWGFVPLSPEDLAGLDMLMKLMVPREAFKIVELAGRPVAVLLLIPNFFELFRNLAPSPGPAGWIKLLWRAATHRFRSGRVIVTGLVKELQGTITGSAIVALLFDELMASQARFKGERIEAGWVLEDNRALIQILETFSFERSKTFRIYQQSLPS